MERRFLPAARAHVAVERGAADDNAITGVASVFYDGTPGTEYELWSGVFERILPGAFDRAIKENDDVRALFNHDPSLLLARTTSHTLRLWVDKIGLRYEIDPGDTQVARDVLIHIERGDVTGSSFAFTPTDESWRKEAGKEIREIKGVKLYDVAPVTYPAYEATSAGTRSNADPDEARVAYDAWKTAAARRARSARARARLVELNLA